MPEATAPRCTDLEEVLARLDAGEVVAVPTESSYALAARIDRPAGLERLAELKRGRDKPIGLLIAHPRQLPGYVAEVPPVAFDLARAYWPGPLTMVFAATANVPDLVTAGTGSVAFRVPGHGRLRELLARVGVPLTGTSANPPGQPPAYGAVALARYFPDLPVWVVDDPLPERPPSTLVDVRAGYPEVLRPGPIRIG